VGAIALPATQMTLTVPDTIGEPIAAVPLKALVAGVLSPPPPSQPDSDNVATTVRPMPSIVALRKVFLSCKMSSPCGIEPQKIAVKKFKEQSPYSVSIILTATVALSIPRTRGCL
jgi:hypothetical protein